jgi:hypothetical protein
MCESPGLTDQRRVHFLKHPGPTAVRRDPLQLVVLVIGLLQPHQPSIVFFFVLSGDEVEDAFMNFVLSSDPVGTTNG